MLLDDIVSGIKKKQAPRASAPSKPQIETRADADNEQILPDRSDHKIDKDEATQRLLHGLGNSLQGGIHQEDVNKNSDFDQDSDQEDSGQEDSDQEDSEHENSNRDDSD